MRKRDRGGKRHRDPTHDSAARIKEEGSYESFG